MNVLHVVDSGGFYGKEKIVLELLKGMPYKPEVINISSNKTFEHEVMKAGLPTPVSLAFNSQSAIRYLKECVTRGHWDIIHCHGYKESFYAILYSMLRPNLRTKIIRTLHGTTATSKFSKMFLYMTLDKFLLRFHDKVISVSPNERYHVIFNGISNPDAELPDIRNDKHKRMIDFCILMKPSITDPLFPVLVSAGRLSKEKNYAELIRAISGVSDIKLVIMGDGAERPVLEKLIQELGLSERVMLTGFIENPARYYRLFDFYIQPSLTEGVPTAVLEAAYCHKPLLLSYVGGMKLFIDNDAAIRIGTDKNDMIEVLKRVLKTPLTRRYFEGKAYDFVSQKFSVEAMIMNYKALYLSMVSEKTHE